MRLIEYLLRSRQATLFGFYKKKTIHFFKGMVGNIVQTPKVVLISHMF